MCDNCKQVIKDKQPTCLSLNINGISFTMDCHIDCLPDWMRSFHVEQVAKYKTVTPDSPIQFYSTNKVTF